MMPINWHHDREAQPLWAAPCRESARERGCGIAGRHAVTIVSDILRQIVTQAARESHLGVDDRGCADVEEGIGSSVLGNPKQIGFVPNRPSVAP